MGIEELARRLGINPASIDAIGLKAEYAATTGRIILPGTEEEKDFYRMVSNFAQSFTTCPSDLRASFKRFIADPGNYPNLSSAHSSILRSTTIEDYRRLAESFRSQALKLQGQTNEGPREEPLELERLSLAVAKALKTGELKTHEFYTLRDAASLASSPATARIGQGFLHLIASEDGLRPGFQFYLMGLVTEARTVDFLQWRRALDPLMEIGSRAGSEPRFQDIWIVAFDALPQTIIMSKTAHKFVSRPTTPEMLIQGIPSENDVNDARKKSIVVLLADGEHQLASLFLTYIFSRRAGRGILDGIIHVAAARPLVPVARELIYKATKALEDLTNSRKDDFKEELWRTALRVWHIIRPLMDKNEVQTIAKYRSADVYLKDYYRKNRGPGGNNGSGGARPAGGSTPPARDRQITLFEPAFEETSVSYMSSWETSVAATFQPQFQFVTSFINTPTLFAPSLLYLSTPLQSIHY
jgi:hypothetical protein